MNELLARKISNYASKDGDWLELEDLLQEAFSSENSQEYYRAMLSLFENHPGEDGVCVFWAVVHGVKYIGGYSSKLLLFFNKSLD